MAKKVLVKVYENGNVVSTNYYTNTYDTLTQSLHALRVLMPNQVLKINVERLNTYELKHNNDMGVMISLITDLQAYCVMYFGK